MTRPIGQPAPGRFHACLVPLAGADRFVSRPVDVAFFATIAHCGVVYDRTAERTAGGWAVYREALA